MVDQSKRLDLGKTAPVTAGNEGDAQAVKACIHPGCFEYIIDSAILVGRQNAGHMPVFRREAFQRWAKGMMNRYAKVLPGVIFLALCIAQPYSAACQVDIFHWDRALGKPASGVESDFKASPHPFRLICELSPNLPNLGIRQFWFDFLRCPGNAESSNWVGLGKLAPDGFVNELGEEFDLKQSGVVSDFSTVDLGCQSPANIRPAMRVSDLSGVNDALLIQERFNGSPSNRVTPSRISFALPMGCDVAGNPGSESRGTGRTADPLFFDCGFIGQPLSFSGVSGIVDSQAGGFLDPQTGVQITFTKIPKRGAFLLSQMSHPGRVVQSRPRHKWINVDYPPCSEEWPWAGECCEILPLHHEASFFPVENSRVVQESLISGCFLRVESTGNPRFGKESAWLL